MHKAFIKIQILLHSQLASQITRVLESGKSDAGSDLTFLSW